MIYINPKGEYPRHIGDIQLEHPDFKEGDTLPEGWVKVQQAERPAVGTDELVYEGFPNEVNGEFVQNWQVRDMTAEEIERRDAPQTAKQKLIDLGLTEFEVQALLRGLVR